MSIKQGDTITVAVGSPIWRSFNSDDRIAWLLDEGNSNAKSAPEGKVETSDGVKQFKVVYLKRTSEVFNVKRTKCAVILDKKKQKWFCYMHDLVRVGPPPPPSKDDLLSSVEEDKKGVPAGLYISDGEYVPYTAEEIATAELARRERCAERFKLAMAEFGALNLEVGRRVNAINKMYGLEEEWVGTLQVRVK